MVIIVYYIDAPQLTMGLHLGEPTVRRKCRRLEIHSIVHYQVPVVYPRVSRPSEGSGFLPHCSVS